MWFFGLLTTLCFSVYFVFWRLGASWKGVTVKQDGHSYEYRFLRHKGRLKGILLGVRGADGFDFSFKPERWYDRLFKALGLSVEHQVGHDAFDRQVYVVSNDRRVLDALSENTGLVTNVLALFRAGSARYLDVRAINCRAGRLWIKGKSLQGFSEEDRERLAAKLVPLLTEIALQVANAIRPRGSRWRDPYVIKAAVILAISTGLAVNGLIQTVRMALTTTPFTVDTDALSHSAIGWSAGIVGGLVLATLLVLGRTARTHLVLLELLLVGGFGAYASSLIELRDINMAFDSRPASEYVVVVREMTVSRSRRSTRYYLTTDDWNGSLYQRFQVAADLYRRLTPGDRVVISQRPGYLGYRWVESVRKGQ